MSQKDLIYHRERARHCRTMAELASDPDIRRRHEELASLHSSRAAQFAGLAEPNGELRAN